MGNYKIVNKGDTLELFLNEKLIGGKWRGKRWHAIIDGAWAYQVDARSFPKCIKNDIKLIEKVLGWK